MPVMGYRGGMTGTEIATTSAAVDRVGGSSLPSLLTAWLGSYSSANTQAAYARDARAWIAWCDEHGVDPLQVMRPHVDAWARALDREGYRPTTKARRLASVASWYRYLVGLGVVPANPVADIRRPKTGEGYVDLTPSLDREEVSRLLAAATDPRDRALVVVLVVQGLRVSEALSLDLDRTETIRGHVTYLVQGKGGREDRIPLPPLVVDAITALAEAEDRTTGPVFVGEDGERLSRHGVTRALARLSRRAGLSRSVRPHTLRATAITLALDSGASLRDVQDLARHSDPRTTRRYDRNRGALDRHAAYVLAAALAEPEAFPA